MTPLSVPRNTPSRSGREISHPLAAGAKIWQGCLVVLNPEGFARAAHTAPDLTPCGIAVLGADNTAGTDGAVSLVVERGVFCLDNDAADPITRAHVGKLAYITDDHTLCATDGAGTKSVAGKIISMETDGRVWLEIR